MSTMLLVNEVYPCLQGEGINLGKASVLLRLQICNLRCTWCDTPYTHTKNSDPVDKLEPNGKQKFKRMSLEEVVCEIKQYAGVQHVIVSGGEPTLQNFAPLANLLPNHSFEVESNGTRIPHKQVPGFSFDDYRRFQWNISPKGRVAGEEIITDAIDHWANLSKTSEQFVYFKFVIRKSEAESDIAEVVSLQEQHKIDANRIFLMAEGTTIASQVSNIWLHDFCLKYGFRYTPRLHVLLFGAQRGV